MPRKRSNTPLHVEALESRALPASFALSLALDAACDGDPLQWETLHRELTSAACEQIQYWEQQRASSQILDVFHQRSGAERSGQDHDTGESPVKTAEYCEAIDGLIGEVAASEIIRYLDQESMAERGGLEYETLVDHALLQLRSAPGQDSAE